MRVLHTSDWHIGRRLYGRKRYDEHLAFLNWLLETISERQIDLLLVAGDIFDNCTPSNRAQRIYYDFLCKIADTCCRHVVIIGGNHDSPSFLNAPNDLLRSLNIHVIGSIRENYTQEVLTLTTPQGEPQAIVCAVPYLRDRDLRTVSSGESATDKDRKLLEAIGEHYAQVCDLALKTRDNLSAKGSCHIPLIAMGHLFTVGGKTVAEDGVRELYVGSLACITSDTFPDYLDYTALGHLHIPQRVGGNTLTRYSGSPIPMGFGESANKKQVILVEFSPNNTEVQEIAVPTFQPLHRLSGTLEEITSEISYLKEQQCAAWLEIEYTGSHNLPLLQESIKEALADSKMDVLRVINRSFTNALIQKSREYETLDDLDVYDVFERCLHSQDVAPEEHDDLKRAYKEIVLEILEDDKNAE